MRYRSATVVPTVHTAARLPEPCVGGSRPGTFAAWAARATREATTSCRRQPLARWRWLRSPKATAGRFTLSRVPGLQPGRWAALEERGPEARRAEPRSHPARLAVPSRDRDLLLHRVRVAARAERRPLRDVWREPLGGPRRGAPLRVLRILRVPQRSRRPLTRVVVDDCPSLHPLRGHIEQLLSSILLRMAELFGRELPEAHWLVSERPYAYGYIEDQTLALVCGQRLYVLAAGWSD